MTTTSATSSIISALGGGSGIDMSGLASSLSAAQFAGRTDQLTSKASKLEKQISAASSLKSMLQQLATSVGTNVRSGSLSTQPSIGNSAVATVSRGTASGSGSYSLEVTALANKQILTSPAYTAATSTVGSGTLTLRFGTVSGASFTADSSHAAVPITIAAGATLKDVASAINAANTGVTAYIATGADGAHLMLKGAEGAENGFVLEANETVGDEGLANLAWSPAASNPRLLSTAASAAFKLDGLAMTSKSNTINEVVPGLNLTLTGTNSGSPTTVSFSDPTSAVTSFMQDFTAALNELVSELNTDTKADTGDLVGDSGARTLRRALSSLAGTVIMPSASGSAPKTLSDLGLSIDRYGVFQLDTAKLTKTIQASPNGTAAMFTTGAYGVFATVDKIARNMTSTTDPGSLAGSITRYTNKQTDVTKLQKDIADKQELLRQQLVARFAKVDNNVSASKSTLSFVQAQIAAWNKSGN